VSTARQNLFGFRRKPAPAPSKRKRGGSAMTISSAIAQAREAGYRSRYNFGDWIEMKHLEGRGQPVIDRLVEAYQAGQEKREKDEQAKIDRAEARRDTAERRRAGKQFGKRKAATPRSGGYAGSRYAKSSVPDERTIQEGFKRGLTLNEILRGNPRLRKLKASNPAKFDRCVKEVQARGGASNAYAVCKSALKGKRNPAAASAEVFEDFHGYAPSEVITVTKKIHHHEHLAALGWLVYLEVWGIDKRGHKLTAFKRAILASNEDRNQLFIEGGDQAIELKEFGIRQSHEMETLGKVLTVAYSTDKRHLGSEGGKAVYVHDFTTTNQNGKHVKVPEARLPQLIYDVRNEQLLFSGGSYEILREGIDK
jgi:hypothetical protein